jgi:1-phosphofructokinase family hexose kinase
LIFTITLNPSIDLQYQIDEFKYNTVIRSNSVQKDLGGKGFNVSHALKVLKKPSTALGLIGGNNGKFLVDKLDDMGIVHDLFWIRGESRINTTIIQEYPRKHIKINEPGPAISKSEQLDFMEKIINLAQVGDWFVFSGSLPQCDNDKFYAQLIKKVINKGAITVLDSSGIPFSEGIKSKPYLVKPNRDEIKELSGKSPDTTKGIIEAIRMVHKLGVEIVCLSLGKQGAIISDGKEMISGSPPVIEEINPTGAGDALVAGLVTGLDEQKSLSSALRLGIACGTAAASMAGTGFGSIDIIKEIARKVKITSL